MQDKQEEIQRSFQMIRVGLERLERLLGQGEAAVPDPYARRQQLLEYVYAQEGVGRPELMRALREAGAAYQWIGQQVKKGYLAVVPLPSGKVRYAVTPKAVRELELNQRAIAEEAVAYAAASEEAFAEDWDSPEDAAYDRL
ncbi:MAG: hypothetical protein HYY02_09170 [Chloroflexi bacterium]|nr:hypothetical protein [Chloroflexota bacterium]